MWCKPQNRFWQPACVLERQQVSFVEPEHSAKQSSTASYSVAYFDGTCQLQNFTVLPANRLLPFEQHHATREFAKSYLQDKLLYESILAAANYYCGWQSVQSHLQSTCFAKVQPSWNYQTLANNVSTTNARYIFRRLDNTDNAQSQAVPGATGNDSRPRRHAARKCSAKFADEKFSYTATRCQCTVVELTEEGCYAATCNNALSSTECDNQNCNLLSSSKCRNRRLAELHAPPGCIDRYRNSFDVVDCGIKGKGLVSKVQFFKHSYLIEYVGEVVTQMEQRRRNYRLHSKYDQPMFYYVALDTARVLDAQKMGNLARFANHSCEPNSKICRVLWRGDIHIVLQALSDIAVGEEITFNYDWGVSGENPTICKCNSHTCSGVIGKHISTYERKKFRADDSAHP